MLMAATSDWLGASSEENDFRKPYASPRLEELGDLRELTLGSSVGVTDSGGQTQNVFPTPPP